MKFMHLGDLHLGKNLGEFSLIEDQKYMLGMIVEKLIENNIGGLLIAGDIFDKSVPSEAAVELFDDFLKQRAHNNIKTYIISGNHDSDERLNFGSKLFESNSIFISAKYDGTLRKQSIDDNGTRINIYLLPFIKASFVRNKYPEEKIENYEDAVKVVIKNTEINRDEVNILVAHQFVVSGEKNPETAGSEMILSVGDVERINYTVFDAFDYVALGHIHSEQSVGREAVRYSGSMLKYSLSEVLHEKKAPVIEVTGKEVKIADFIKLVPLRDVRHIKGKIDELLKKENVCDNEDYIYATLTDEEIVNDSMGRIQMYYPKTVKVDYENSHTKAMNDAPGVSTQTDRPFEELFSDFFREMYGEDVTEEEMEIIKKAAEEVGVLNEAD